MSLGREVYTTPRFEELKTRLAQEWREPQSGMIEPILIVEPVEFAQDRMRLYVIWSEWAALKQRERSRIIMEAYQEALGRDAALGVSVAMGLTPDEANRLGIEYAEAVSAAA